MADEPAKKESQEPERYDAEYLMEHSYVSYGVPPTTMAAALSTETRQSHTENQVKQMIARVEKAEIDPYDGVAETYPRPEGAEE